MSLDARAAARLAALSQAGLLRRPPPVSRRNGVAYRLGDTDVVGFCSNDYLGLSAEPIAMTQAFAGSGASRLIAGDLPDHRRVEARLASLCGAADAVLFPSGFQLNVGVIPCLVEPTDRVHSDRLNHASIIDGLRLAKARPEILAHGSAPALPAPHDGLQWWFTESIFSMDGDRVDRRALSEHQRRGGTTYVDEAHAFGLFPGGAGLLHDHAPRPDVLVGTLSKAYGCAGAFVAASLDVCRLIRNRARSFVFTTGTAPVVAATIDHRLDVVTGERGDELRAALWSNARAFEAAVLGHDPSASDPPSPIFPILVGDNRHAVEIAEQLVGEGFHVQAIRPPTVPDGTARLRVTITAAHTLEQIDALAETLRRVFAEHDLPVLLERGHIPPDRSPRATAPSR